MDSLCEQMVPKRYYKHRVNLKLTFALWWLCCISLTTLYKAKLASIMFAPPHREPHSLQEVLEGGYDIVRNVLGDGGANSVYQMPGSLSKEVHSRTKNKTGRCASLLYALTNGAALFAECNELKYNLQIQCPWLIGHNKTVAYDMDLIRIVPETIVEMYHGWPVGKHVRYISSFSHISRRLLDGGFLSMWQIRMKRLLNNLYDIQEAKDNKPIGGGINPGGLTSFASAFVLFAVGMAVSIICLIIEVSLNYHCTNRR